MLITNIIYQHIYMESRKMVQMNQLARQEQKCRCREQTCEHREKGEGGMNWGSRINICTLCCCSATKSCPALRLQHARLLCTISYMKQMAGGKLVHSRGSSAQGSLMTQRGAVGGECGREAQKRGDICDICILIAYSHYFTVETNTLRM